MPRIGPRLRRTIKLSVYLGLLILLLLLMLLLRFEPFYTPVIVSEFRFWWQLWRFLFGPRLHATIIVAILYRRFTRSFMFRPRLDFVVVVTVLIKLFRGVLRIKEFRSRTGIALYTRAM